MNFRKVLSLFAVSFVAAGLVLAQDAPRASKGNPLRNKTPLPAKQRPTQAGESLGVPIQYTRVSAPQFTTDVNPDSYTSTWLPGFDYSYQRWFNGAGFNHLVSSPTIPGGARITYLELDACDSNTMDQHVQINAYYCDWYGECDSTPFATITSASDTMNPCQYPSTSSLSQRVLNFTGQVLLDVTFGATDGTNSFAGAIVGYVLEPAPAPANATFLDVPTGSPQFQFVEALVASGITAGCGGGNYCPTNPVTRGQMAVFLSKLAGLGFWE